MTTHFKRLWFQKWISHSFPPVTRHIFYIKDLSLKPSQAAVSQKYLIWVLKIKETGESKSTRMCTELIFGKRKMITQPIMHCKSQVPTSNIFQRFQIWSFSLSRCFIWLIKMLYISSFLIYVLDCGMFWQILVIDVQCLSFFCVSGLSVRFKHFYSNSLTSRISPFHFKIMGRGEFGIKGVLAYLCLS